MHVGHQSQTRLFCGFGLECTEIYELVKEAVSKREAAYQRLITSYRFSKKLVAFSARLLI